jgi:hypothetical protein
MNHLTLVHRICRRLVLWLLVFSVLPVWGQFNQFVLPYGKNRVTVNFENFDNLVVVDAMISDSIPVRLIVDSGVEGVVITDMDVVNELAGRCVRSFRVNAPGTIEVLEACITSPVSISLKGLVPSLFNLIMLNQDYFSLEQYIGTKVHGLIGIDKFRNMVVTTDYDRNVLTFQEPSTYRLPARAQVIPISTSRGKPHMTSRVELDDGRIIDVWLMIDSGANHPLLLENDSLGDYKPLKSVEAVIGKGLAGSMHGRFARIGWMTLGNFRLDNVITSFTDDYMPGSNEAVEGRHGTLGAGALSRFVVTFDYSRERMILRKGNKFRQPFEYNMSGITFRTIESHFNVFEISDIIKNSPADEAGLKPGDILLSIDSKSTLTMKLGEVNRLLSEKEGARVSLLISRDGKTEHVRLKLKKLI